MSPGTQAVPTVVGTGYPAMGCKSFARDQERSAGSTATEYSWGADIPGGLLKTSIPPDTSPKSD